VHTVKVGVLNNLRAGKSRRVVSRILHLLRFYPQVAHVETESVGALPEALAELAREDVELLVINGGDGTLQHTLNEILAGDAFEGRVPMIAPLRGGRTNMTALDLGAHRSPVKGLAGLLASVEAGHVQERFVARPVLRVRSATRLATHYGMFFGAGMIHRAIDLTHRVFPNGRSQGVFGASVVTASLVAKAAIQPKHGVLRPDKLQILLDGELVPNDLFMLVISSTLHRLFAGIRPFWGEGPGGVRFTCIAPDVERYGRAAPGILFGRPPAFVRSEPGYTSRNVHRAELRLDCGFTVDGEIFAGQPDEIVTLTADRRVSFVRA
jgi:diacylglycerol kinase family enzyme